MHTKKQLLLTALFLLMTMPYALGHLTGAKLHNFQYNAELVPVAPIVDGYLDDPVWEDADPGKLTQEVMTGDPWPESDDFTGTFAAVLAEAGSSISPLKSRMTVLRRMKPSSFVKTIWCSTWIRIIRDTRMSSTVMKSRLDGRQTH